MASCDVPAFLGVALLSTLPRLDVSFGPAYERRVEPAVFVLDSEDARWEPPLDGPADRHPVAPAVGVAAAGRVARVVQVLEKRSLHASRRERLGCFRHRGGGAILSLVAGWGRRRRSYDALDADLLTRCLGGAKLARPLQAVAAADALNVYEPLGPASHPSRSLRSSRSAALRRPIPAGSYPEVFRVHWSITSTVSRLNAV